MSVLSPRGKQMLETTRVPLGQPSPPPPPQTLDTVAPLKRRSADEETHVGQGFSFVSTGRCVAVLLCYWAMARGRSLEEGDGGFAGWRGHPLW